MSDKDRTQRLPWIRTPLVESALLSKVAGCRIYLKLENLQPSGSFKSRGPGNFIRQHLLSAQADANSAPPHFYTSSGGNAGLACVTACHTLGYPSTVVVPLSTLPHMVDKIRLAGASQVIQHGRSWYEADQHLRNEILSKDPGGVYVPPFDHPDVWKGNSTLIDEVREELGEVDGVVCSVGGGGLFCGIMEGLQGTNTTVVATETKGAESLHVSLEAGELTTLPGITSIATSLGAVRVAEQAFKYGQEERVNSVVVTDDEACRACVTFAEEERMLVEPACGAALSVAYEGKLKTAIKGLGPESKVVIVVCGGRNIGLDLIAEWKAKDVK